MIKKKELANLRKYQRRTTTINKDVEARADWARALNYEIRKKVIKIVKKRSYLLTHSKFNISNGFWGKFHWDNGVEFNAETKRFFKPSKYESGK